MKDKKIIKIISIMYFIIVSFLSFMAMAVIAAFIVLQNGVDIQELSFQNITIKKIHIQWEKKINIAIGELDIEKSNQTKQKSRFQKIIFEKLSQYISLNERYFSLIESIKIKKIKYDAMTATLKYNNNEKGVLSVKSPNFSLQSHFRLQKDNFIISIDTLKAMENKINIHGIFILNSQTKKVFTNIDILANHGANFKLYAIATQKQLKYSLESKNEIRDIHSLVALFHLPNSLKYWTVDAIDAKSLTINKVKGFVQYDKLESAYKNIHILAAANNLNYKYNPKLDAIHTKKTKLELLDGILYIRPKKATTYNMRLQKSWVKIDFTKPETMLAVNLLFDGVLNKNLLHILNTYDIRLPFLQHTGKVKTNLTLKVNLETLKVYAQGTFLAKKANFDYLGINIDVSDVLIKLNNNKIGVARMKARYKNIAQADVVVHYNTTTATGDIDLLFKKIQLAPDKHLDTKSPLKVVYKITPKGDSVIVADSKWEIDGMPLVLDTLKLPVDMKTLHVSVPSTHFNIENIANGFVKGVIDVKHSKADLALTLLTLNYQGITLAQAKTNLSLHVNKVININSSKKILFTLNDIPGSVKNLSIDIEKKRIRVRHAKLKIDKIFKSNIYVLYDIKRKKGSIYLENCTFINPKTKEVLYKKKNLKLLLTTRKKLTEIDISEFEAILFLSKKRWILNFNSLKKIAKYSKILKKYHIENGNIIFYKKDSDEAVKFKAFIDYKYKLLTKRAKPVTKYIIKGEILKNKDISLNINDNVNIYISDDVHINIKNSGINNTELLKFIKLFGSKRLNAKGPNIYITAKNSYIYLGNNRYVVSDTIKLQYKNGVLKGKLLYGKGEINLKYKNGKFRLWGKNLNDKFAEELSSSSKFKGGRLDFSMHGTFNDYKGYFHVKNTLMSDYTLLNNIFAFVNTIPSLATFSLPGYNLRGIYINNAFLKFHFKNAVYYISDFNMKSKEIKLSGQGRASVAHDMIDMKLELQTDIGSRLSKIPLAGYIIFDGKSLAINLKVTGKLTNPKVTTMITKDIISAPTNIIKRTFNLPLDLIKKISK